MSIDNLIENINMNCALCNKTHEVEIRRRATQGLVKGEAVEYEETYYRCCNSDEEENEFVSAGVMDENLLAARNAYRKAKGLLTSDEIIDIRNFYNLSQSDFSSLLGWGEVTISRYETKAIQDETYDLMMRLVYENPIFALHLLEKHKAKFTEEKYYKTLDLLRKSACEKSSDYIQKYFDQIKAIDAACYMELNNQLGPGGALEPTKY